jgi:hypothetical protein
MNRIIPLIVRRVGIAFDSPSDVVGALRLAAQPFAMPCKLSAVELLFKTASSSSKPTPVAWPREI